MPPTGRPSFNPITPVGVFFLARVFSVFSCVGVQCVPALRVYFGILVKDKDKIDEVPTHFREIPQGLEPLGKIPSYAKRRHSFSSSKLSVSYPLRIVFTYLFPNREVLTTSIATRPS